MKYVWDTFLEDLKKNKIDITLYSLRDILELFWTYQNNPHNYEKWLKEH